VKNKIQIVVVDDNPTFLEGLSVFIDNEKYEIIARFNSGVELIKNIMDYDPDIVLLDIEMPEMNGIETAERLNNYGTQLKLIAVTLYYDKAYVNALIEAGFRGMISKNEITEKLFPVIERVMEGDLAF
jgi:DNA-binding NarL/FixJ family response regulator